MEEKPELKMNNPQSNLSSKYVAFTLVFLILLFLNMVLPNINLVDTAVLFLLADRFIKWED